MLGLTKYQFGLLKSLNGGNCDDDFYIINYNDKNIEEFEKLVTKGLVINEPQPDWMGNKLVYRITQAGRKITKAITKGINKDLHVEL